MAHGVWGLMLVVLIPWYSLHRSAQVCTGLHRSAQVCKEVGLGLHRSAQVCKRSAQVCTSLQRGRPSSARGLLRSAKRSVQVCTGLCKSAKRSAQVCTGLRKSAKRSAQVCKRPQQFLPDSSGEECFAFRHTWVSKGSPTVGWYIVLTMYV